MKTTTSITLDAEVLVEARKNIKNLSKTINEMLKLKLGLDKGLGKTEKEIELDINSTVAKLEELKKQQESIKKKKEEDKPLYTIKGGKDAEIDLSGGGGFYGS